MVSGLSRFGLYLLVLLGGLAGVGAQGVAPNGLRQGGWRDQDVPEGYLAMTVGKYQLQTNCPPETAEKVGKQLNAMFRLYSKYFPPTKTPKGGMVVKLFKSEADFRKYGAPPGAAGYFSPTDKEMVGYDTGKLGGISTRGGTTGGSSFAQRLRDRMTFDTLGVFNHEGWHQYFHWVCGSQIAFPAWADEGIGEYFNPAYLENGEMVVGAPNDYRLGTIQAAIRRNRHVPLAELITYEQRQYYANPGLCYAEGWALVHFLFEHPKYAKQKLVQRFVKVFRDEHSIEKTNKQVFGRLDWAEVEADWKTWVMAIPPAPDPDDLEEGLSEATAATARKNYESLDAEARKAIDAVIEKRQHVQDEVRRSESAGEDKAADGTR